jgi:hypothetical protein
MTSSATPGGFRGGLSKTYNAWSGYTFLHAQGVERSRIAPVRGVFAGCFLALTALQTADAFVSPEPLKSLAGAAFSLAAGGGLLWGAAAAEVGIRKAGARLFGKPKPPEA